MADDLQQERTRLASRMREQLWRYYPQMLELADDLAADWFLDLWNLAPTPAKAVGCVRPPSSGLSKRTACAGGRGVTSRAVVRYCHSGQHQPHLDTAVPEGHSRCKLDWAVARVLR